MTTERDNWHHDYEVVNKELGRVNALYVELEGRRAELAQVAKDQAWWWTTKRGLLDSAAAVRTERDQLERELASAHKDLTAARADRDRFQRERNQFAATMPQSRDTAAAAWDYAAQIASLQGDVRQLGADNARLQKEIDHRDNFAFIPAAVVKEINDLKAQLQCGPQVKEITDLRTEVARCKDSRDAALRKLAEEEAYVRELKQGWTAAKSKELADLHNALDAIKVDRNGWREEADRDQKVIETLNHDLDYARAHAIDASRMEAVWKEKFEKASMALDEVVMRTSEPVEKPWTPTPWCWCEKCETARGGHAKVSPPTGCKTGVAGMRSVAHQAPTSLTPQQQITYAKISAAIHDVLTTRWAGSDVERLTKDILIELDKRLAE